MIVIGVSGSTKCDWVILNEAESVARFSTRGINPLFHDQEEIASILSSSADIVQYARAVTAVFIYSAGCSNKIRQQVVIKALYSMFPKAHHYVNHDIVASALAVYDGTPCMAAILGTGANACYFDGDIIRQEVPALDYILGDEGGGAWYGKRLLSAYAYKQLPEDLQMAFRERYPIHLDEVLENVYMKPYANVYLASFMNFIQDHEQHPYIEALLHEGMGRFMDIYLLSHPKHSQVKSHFTGSLAHYFEHILRIEAGKRGIIVGEIIKEPIDRLVAYHLNKNYKS
jgi:N-acetylglucosamine kinase-like BadF-type ATPase